MKTEELVALLATAAEPVDPKRAGRRYLYALILGTLTAFVFTSSVLRMSPAQLHQWTAPMFWVRETFCSTLALLGLIAVARLARPGTRLGLVPAGLGLTVVVLWTIAAVTLARAPAHNRVPLMLGQMAPPCTLLIAVTSIPLFIGFFWALRGFAPTQLRLAGGAAGLAGGATGALVYSLYCPELAAPFLSLWYVLGILIPTSLGACLGPRLLRW